jgi:hypothetical protein
MKTLSDDLKRILSGLAHQSAGEFLPMREKMKAFESEAGLEDQPGSPRRGTARRAATPRVALICDGNLPGAPLEYAMDAASRQGATIDLLVHGASSMETLSALETQVRTAGHECRRIQLDLNAVDALANYARNSASLLFLVAATDNSVVKTLMEEVIPQRGGRLPVPLVLIENRPAASAAA